MNQTFTQEEAEEILTRAVRQQVQGEGIQGEPSGPASPGRITESQLSAMAAELGIPVEVLRHAQAEWQAQHAEVAERQAYNRHLRGEWGQHIIVYMIVNSALVGMDLVLAHHITWSIFPLLGWGIGLAFHTLETFFHFGAEYEKGFERWREKGARKTNKQ